MDVYKSKIASNIDLTFYFEISTMDLEVLVLQFLHFYHFQQALTTKPLIVQQIKQKNRNIQNKH